MIALCVALLACAVSAQWKALTTSIETFDTGIDFINDQTGYTAGDNGEGPAVYVTSNGGTQWNQLSATFGADLILLDVAAAGQNVIVTGVFGNFYSNNGGLTFNYSKGEYGPSQSIRAFGTSGNNNFGVAGEFLETNGVAITNNGGQTFKTDSVPLFTSARYGVYPSASTWYITAGQWPDTSGKPRSPRRRFELQNDEGRFPAEINLKGFRETANDDDNGNGYMAQLSRTTNAGQTWTTVIAVNNSYYFNGIDCDPSDPNHCCAVGEAFDIANAGAHILCTTDGTSWTENFFAAENGTHGYSLLDIRFSNSTYLWAAGGVLGNVPNAWFLRSNDGGQTWAQGSPLLPALYAMSLTSPSTSVSYAAVDNTVLQKSGVAKYTAP